MEFLKNVSGEISRSLDSTPQKSDETEKNGSDNVCEDNLPRIQDNNNNDSNKKIINETDDWGNWEVTRSKATPTNTTPTNIKQSPGPAGTGTKTATTPTTTPVKSTKLSEFSKDELIERIKKQTALLQKMKTRSEELSKECNRLKIKVADDHMTSKDEHLLAELQVLKSERDQTLVELKSVKQIVIDTDKEMKKVTESLENEVTILKNENHLLNGRTKELEQEHHVMEDNLRGEMATLKEELVLCKKEREGLMNQLSDKNTTLINERDNERVELQKELTTLQDTLATVQETANEAKKKMAGEFDEYKRDNEERIIIEREKLMERCRIKEDEIAIMKENELVLMRSLEEEKQEGNKLIEELKMATDNSQTREDGRQEEVLQSEIMKLKNEIIEIRREHDIIMEDNDNERKELMASKERDIGLINEEMKQKQEQITEIQSASREEIKKYKSIALKLKKELTEIKEKEAILRNQLDGNENKQIQEMKKELDSDKDQLVVCRERMSEMEEEIKLLQEKMSNEKNKNEQLLKDQSGQFTENYTQLEEMNIKLKQEISNLTINWTNVNTELDNTKEAIDNYVVEISSLKEALSQERNLVCDTQQRVIILEKDVKSSSLIDLELADYQRSIDGLKEQLTEKQETIAKLEQKMTTIIQQKEQLQQERDDLKNDVIIKEEMATKLKAMLRKSTKDLSDSRNQITKMEKDLDQLQEELESRRRHEEDVKIEIATLSAQIQSNDNQYHTSTTSQQQKIQLFEAKVTKLHYDLQQRNEEIIKINQEHDNYKVRVHSVLKQKSTAPSVDIENEIRHKHETELLKTKAELKEASEQLSSLLVEHDEIMTEYNQLINRHEQLLIDSKREKQHLNDKLFETEGKFTVKTKEYEDTITVLRDTITNNIQVFKNKVQLLEETHYKETQQLQQHLDTSINDLNRLQQDIDTHTLITRRNTQQIHSRENSVAIKLNEMTLLSEERSAGEGMDTDELKNTSTEKANAENNTGVSLERLLSASSTSDIRTTNVSPIDDVDISVLQMQLNLSMKKTSHVTELLRESEENGVRLTDQAKLLKEEIRRLERNIERQIEASNMEYLKNVVLKFLHTENDEERVGLIPIITRLLQLSQTEITYLSQTIKGNKVALPDDPTGMSSHGNDRAKGWGTYLHRWTGY